MNREQIDIPDSSKLRSARRKAVILSQQAMIRTEMLREDKTLPMMITPAVKGVDLLAWAANHRELIEADLLKYGSLLFRGFKLRTEDEFRQFIQVTSGDLLEYRERSSPRSEVGDRIYTSTDYPAEHSIFLHNENSYQCAWPMKIFFFCVKPAERGGETTIADCRRVFDRIEERIRERLIQLKWMYVRNFGDGFGLGWQTVFQTDDRSAVEEHCRRSGIEVEWKAGSGMRIRAARPAIELHPRTGEITWFNHATFFHVTTLEKSVREALLAEFEEEDLPTNTYYGDGTEIESSVLDHLREAYLKEAVSISWQQGDVLMLDNMLVAHGRASYFGERRILVGMAEPLTRPLSLR